MEYFYKKTQDNDLWLGHNSNHGWVIYDRLLPINAKAFEGNLLFIKCSDWSFFTEKKSNWNYPVYSFVITYLEDLDFKKKSEAEKRASDYLDLYISKKKNDLKTNYIQTIHNIYRQKKGLPEREIVKSSSRTRRESVCWSCRNTVDNKYDLECSACVWIICSNCGACKKNGCI